MAAKLSAICASSICTARSALTRSSVMRRSTPRTSRELVSIARCASSRYPTSSAAALGSVADFPFSLRSCFSDKATAAAKRSRSASTSSGGIRYSGTDISPSSLTKAGPMAMPAETASPFSTRSDLAGLSPAKDRESSRLIEAAADQFGERRDGTFGVGTARPQLDGSTGAGGQHHQSHDGTARHGSAILRHHDLGIELPGELDKTGGRARMQATLVADGHHTPNLLGAVTDRAVVVSTHPLTSAKSCEATLMYLRPASCAPRTALASVSLDRKLASLMSIGRLMPAMTSIFALSMTEIARFDGVPPNMSVSSTTPSPVSTSATQRNMSCRRFSMSSSGPMHTAAILRCGPTTCSSAATNSAASRPWVTRTIPIMLFPYENARRRRRRPKPSPRIDRGRDG